MRIALIGTRGVPARYGGFETCVEEVGARLVGAGHRVVVYSRPHPDGPTPTSYRGMEIVELPALRRRSLETLSHTARSVLHESLRGTDAAVVFNSANAPLLPVVRLRGVPVATHVDGLEWQRAKWGPVGSRYYRAAEALAVRWSDALIADATGIADYYRDEFRADTRLIAYGAPILEPGELPRLGELGLDAGGYHLVVARFEPENHVREIVAGYVASAARLPLVVVGSAPYAEGYTAEVEAAADPRVRFLGGVWDQELLDQLYAGAASYLHGHSVGGTNPSLLRAAGAGAYTIAFDTVFNREVLGDDGDFFTASGELGPLLDKAEADPAATRARGDQLRTAIARYDWDSVAGDYLQLCEDLRTGVFAGVRRPSGRRHRSAVAPPATEVPVPSTEYARVRAFARPRRTEPARQRDTEAS